MKHRETHPEYVEDCKPCKWATVGLSAASIIRERQGEGPALGDQGTKAYVEKMFEDRRRDGLADPIPRTKEAAKFAPAAGVTRDKKYRKANGGL